MRAFFLGAALSASVGALAVTANAAQSLPHRDNPQAGAQLALRTCDICHIVARNQEYPPIMRANAPTFFEIANEPGITTDALQEFLTRPHAFTRMPYPDLTADQIADVTAYILSLRGRH